MPSAVNQVNHANKSSNANVLMCKQWWKVCWMYGDQQKFYRKLYKNSVQNSHGHGHGHGLSHRNGTKSGLEPSRKAE